MFQPAACEIKLEGVDLNATCEATFTGRSLNLQTQKNKPASNDLNTQMFETEITGTKQL